METLFKDEAKRREIKSSVAAYAEIKVNFSVCRDLAKEYAKNWRNFKVRTSDPDISDDEAMVFFTTLLQGHIGTQLSNLPDHALRNALRDIRIPPEFYSALLPIGVAEDLDSLNVCLIPEFVSENVTPASAEELLTIANKMRYIKGYSTWPQGLPRRAKGDFLFMHLKHVDGVIRDMQKNYAHESLAIPSSFFDIVHNLDVLHSRGDLAPLDESRLGLKSIINAYYERVNDGSRD